MSTKEIVYRLALIKSFWKNQVNYDELEVKEAFTEIERQLKKNLVISRDCIKELENIKDEETAKKGKEEINSVIENLQQLI